MGIETRERSRSVWTAPVLVALMLALCTGSVAGTVKDDLKAAADLRHQGQLFRAAEAYLKILRSSPGEKKARSALESFADEALDEKVTAAEALGAELRLDDAIAALDAAGRAQERMGSLGVVVAHPDRVMTARKHLVEHRVEGLIVEAERALADGLWSAAIAHYQQIEKLKPGTEVVRHGLPMAWMEWGEMNIREGRLRAAAERFEEAARSRGTESKGAGAKAAAIRRSLGVSALGQGACRAAVADLRAAERVAPGSIGAELLNQATACAKTCVQISLAVDPHSGVSDDFSPSLEAEIRRQVGAEASEFLVIRASGAAKSAGCNRRTLPGVGGVPMVAGPYSVIIRVTASGSARQPASSVTRQDRSSTIGVDTITTWEQYTELVTGTMSGWVTVTDQSTGGAAVPLPIKVTAEASARWRRDPVVTSTVRDPRTGRLATGTLIGTDDGGKGQAEIARREARRSVANSLAASFAAEASRLVLSVLDVEPTIPDPDRLP